VVRLVASGLGRAEDLALEVPGVRARRRVRPGPRGSGAGALGFPGWVLLHHPAEADYALAVVKEMEALARLARSKPGAAKEGYEEIARRLARTVPHFLPTYFEQAGRAFLDAGSAGQASVMFGKGAGSRSACTRWTSTRSAWLAVFLEFALAGAITARGPWRTTPSSFRDSGDPAGAYATFRRPLRRGGRALACRRGPTWRRSSAGWAAPRGVDLDADEAGPADRAAGRAAARQGAPGLLEGVPPSALDLARRSPAARGALLNLLPGDPSTHDWWLGLLDGAGALEALTRPAADVPAETAPRGGRPRGGPDRPPRPWPGGARPARRNPLFALLPRMARRLRAGRKPR